MATIYKFNVRCVSAFCAYEQKLIENIVRDALNNWVDPVTGLTLESIEINVTKEPPKEADRE
jgi:hypothetical protein